jgi:hypothetical protein
MGLDTTHDAWHGPYGSFSRWRHAVAVAAGIIGEDGRLYPAMWDSEGVVPCPIDWDFWDTQTNYRGKWVKDPEDVIWVLLAHSDCDGHIKKRFLLPLADRLEGLLDKLSSDAYSKDMHYYWFSPRGKAEKFIAGLRLAASENKKVKFY